VVQGAPSLFTPFKFQVSGFRFDFQFPLFAFNLPTRPFFKIFHFSVWFGPVWVRFGLVLKLVGIKLCPNMMHYFRFFLKPVYSFIVYLGPFFQLKNLTRKKYGLWRSEKVNFGSSINDLQQLPSNPVK